VIERIPEQMDYHRVSARGNGMNNQALPKVSVVTPSYNQGRFIEETILSVISQDYPNLEYIIVDGGSTDETMSIVEKYRSQVSYCISEPDNGQSDALNKGFTLSNGQVLAWINSDDVYLPGAISAAVHAMMVTDTSVVYGDFELINAESHVLGTVRSPDFDAVRLLNGDYIPQPSTFFKRSAFFDVGRLDESLHYSMDYDLWLKMALGYRFLHVPKTLSRFRLHIDSKTVSAAPLFLSDSIKMFDRLLPLYIQKEWKYIFNIYSQIFWNMLHLLVLRDVDPGIEIPDFNRQLSVLCNRFLDQMKTGTLFSEATDPLKELLILLNNIYGNERPLSSREEKEWVYLQEEKMLDLLDILYNRGDPQATKSFVDLLAYDIRTIRYRKSFDFIFRILLTKRGIRYLRKVRKMKDI
jgi:glycosyltransferase involved in cell wall biosynthesis